MHNRYTFIAIEGVDGIGKTTIARRLVKNLNAFYMKVPPPSFKWVARLLDKFCNPEIESIGYYLLAIYTSFLIRRLLKRRSVICDKYILTTIVDQTVLGGKIIHLIKRIRYFFILKPDYTFCLTIFDKNDLDKRLRERNIDMNDKQLLPYWQQINQQYQTFLEVLPIETTYKNIDEVLAQIYKYLK